MAIAAGNTEWQNNVIRLKRDAIRRVDIVELPYKYRGDYAERPTKYMVTLNNETRPRRVYATPIGNVSVLYIKSHGHFVYCEAALDSALHSRETV